MADAAGTLANITMKIAGATAGALFGKQVSDAMGHNTGPNEKRSSGQKAADTIGTIYGFGPRKRDDQSASGALDKSAGKNPKDVAQDPSSGNARGTLGGIVAELKTLNTTTMEMNLQLNSHGMKLDRSTSILGDIRSEIARQTDKLAKAIQESGGNVGVTGGSSSGGSSGHGLGGMVGKLAEGAALAGALKGGGKLSEDALKSLAEKGYKPRGTGFVNKAGKFVSAAEIDGALGGQATTVLSKAPGIMSKLGGVGKIVGRFGGPLAGLVSGAEAYHETGSLAQAGGAAAGGWGGMEAGAALGAAGGTMILPGVGTAIGGVVGGLAGSGVGAWAGKKLGSMLDRPHQDASNGNMNVGTLNVTAGTVNVGQGAPAATPPSTATAPAPATPAPTPAPTPKHVAPPALARHSNPTYKTPVTPGVHVTTSTTLEEIARKQGITDPKELAAFLAQIGAEVGSGASMNENLNYKTADRIHTAFKRISVSDAEKLVHNPEALANKAYGGEYGRKNLGNTEEGDGWRYHGRGFIQLTGRANYAAFSQYSGIDILNNPELAARPDIAEQTAVWFWKKNIRPKIKDFGDTAAVTKRVNGGYNGLGERKELDAEYYKELTQYGHILKKHDSKQPIVVVAAPVTNNNQTTNNVAVGKGGSTPRTPTIPSVDADGPTLKSVFGPYV